MMTLKLNEEGKPVPADKHGNLIMDKVPPGIKKEFYDTADKKLVSAYEDLFLKIKNNHDINSMFLSFFHRLLYFYY